MGLTVDTARGFSAGPASLVVKGRNYPGRAGRAYDITPDGRRFLMLKDRGPGMDAGATAIIVVRHRLSELSRLVAGGGAP